MKSIARNLLIYIFILLVALTSKSFAHGGRTDSNGCHNCRTGACAGTYHCHGGGVAAPAVNYAPITIQTPLPTPIPTLQPIQNIESVKNQNFTNNNQVATDKAEVKTNNVTKENPIDTFIKLISILMALGLGYFIYSIFNR